MMVLAIVIKIVIIQIIVIVDKNEVSWLLINLMQKRIKQLCIEESVNLKNGRPLEKSVEHGYN